MVIAEARSVFDFLVTAAADLTAESHPGIKAGGFALALIESFLT